METEAWMDHNGGESKEGVGTKGARTKFLASTAGSKEDAVVFERYPVQEGTQIRDSRTERC